MLDAGFRFVAMMGGSDSAGPARQGRSGRRVGQVFCALALAAGLLADSIPALAEPACTKTWQGPAGGLFSVDANWSGNSVPGGTDWICSGAGSSIVVDQSASVLGGNLQGAITIPSGSTLTVTDTANATTLGTLNLAGGTLGANAGVRLTASGAKKSNWTSGTISIAPGQLTVASSGKLSLTPADNAFADLRAKVVVESAGVFEIAGDDNNFGVTLRNYDGSGSIVINSGGALTKTGGTGASNIQSGVGVTASGKIQATTGKLVIGQLSLMQGVDVIGEVLVSGTNATLDPAGLTIASDSTWLLDGATLVSNADVTVEGTLAWTFGTIVIGGPSELKVAGSGRLSLEPADNSFADLRAKVVVASGGVFEIVGDDNNLGVTLRNYDGSGSIVVNTGGALTKTGGAGSSNIQSGVAVTASGTIQATTGKLVVGQLSLMQGVDLVGEILVSGTSATLDPAGLTIASGSTWLLDGATLLSNADVTVEGTLAWTFGMIVVGGPSELKIASGGKLSLEPADNSFADLRAKVVVAPGGVFEIVGDDNNLGVTLRNYDGSGSIVINAGGALTKTDGAGSSNIQSGVAVTAYGTIQATTGNLVVGQLFLMQGVDLVGEILVSGTSATLDPAGLTIASGSTWLLDGATLVSNADVTVEGTLAWTFGTIVIGGPGELKVANGGKLSLTPADNSFADLRAKVVVASEGVFEIAGDDNNLGVTLRNYDGSGSIVINAGGALTKTGGTGASNIQSGVGVTAYGTIQATTGSVVVGQLFLMQGVDVIGEVLVSGTNATLDPGGLTIASGSTWLLDGATLASNADVLVEGTLAWTFGTIVIGASGEMKVAADGQLSLEPADNSFADLRAKVVVASGGIFEIAADNNNLGVTLRNYDGSGSIVINAGGALVKTGGAGASDIQSGVAVTAYGIVRSTTGILKIDQLTNLSSGVLDGGTYIATSAKIAIASDLTVNNASIVLDGAGSAVVNNSDANALASLTSNGPSGSIKLRHGATGSTETFANAGNLAGGGTLAAGEGLTNSGTVAAEDNGPSTLTLTGNYTQTSAGKLDVTVTGTSATKHSTLAVSADATLAGTLSVAVGYTPAPGDSVTILTAASHTGEFSAIESPGGGPGLGFEVDYSNPTAVVLHLTCTGVCQTCGNGTIDAGEQCDDGNRASGDCCSKDCQYEADGASCTTDNLPCTTDLCDGAGTCEHQPGNQGAVCRAASGECDAAETCTGAAAACPADTKQPSGTSCGSASDNGCDHADTCDGAGFCVVNVAPDGSTCDDANVCTLDVCVGGACQSASIPNCPIVPKDQAAGDEFGTATALSADYLVVGAPASNSESSGRVHVFVPVDGNYVEQLQTTPIPLPFQDPDHATGNLNFGASVDVDKNTIVAGAPFDLEPVGEKMSSGSASVFFFDGTSWVQQAKLLDASGLCSQLGTDVAISGDTIVLGAPGGDCALVFQRTGSQWSESAQLSGGSSGARFGRSVDISGDSILVGAPGAEAGSGCSGQGNVYAFHRSGTDWAAEDTIEEPAGTGGSACFGAAVGVDGISGLIGAPFDDSAASDAGAAYVVERDGGQWSVVQQLLAFPTPAAGDAFGSSLDINGDLIIVGAPGVAAYLFQSEAGVETNSRAIADKWGARRSYVPPGDLPADLSKFAFSVAVAPGSAVVGAPNEDPEGLASAGAVYPSDSAPVSTGCGDGIVSAGEDCDDGDTKWKTGEHCNALCLALVCGDTNDNGKIAAGDALFALKAAVSAAVCDFTVCDATGDRKLTSNDALRILRKAVNLPVTLQCPTS